MFCDYGIVRESQLPFILHVEGRVLWRRPGFDVQLCKSNLSPVTQTASHILLDELLCALYIGLYREKRGERVAAFRSIQVEAVEYLLKLEGADKAAQTSGEDCFSASRRAEQRLPNIKALLTTVMQGYSGNVESAKAVIGFIMQRYPVNLPFAQRILAMCQ